MFGPLARWQEADPLPAVVSNLLTDRQNVQNSAAEKTGSFWFLDLSKRLFRRLTG